MLSRQKTRIISTVSILLVITSVASLGLRAMHGSSAQTIVIGGTTYTSETAKSANDFLNSIGVNVHMRYTNTIYSQSDTVISKLKQLGVRWVRDNPEPSSTNAGNVQGIAGDKKIAATGIKLDFVQDTAGTTATNALVNMVKSSFATSTLAVEGLNELDGTANWQNVLCQNQPNLYRQIKSDPALRNVAVFAPALKGYNENTTGPSLAAVCDLSQYADYGNIHSYPGGQPPESNLAQRIGWQAYVTKARPIVATETGYHNALQNTHTHPPTSEAAAGIYMPRLYLSYFAAGVPYTAAYELLDQGTDQTNQEKMFGLYRNNFSIKPAGQALANLTSILADTASRTSGSLSYRFTSGADSSLQHLLLQKSDGSYYLALWRNSSVWNPATKQTLSAPTINVSVGFPTSMQITTYQPNVSPNPTQATITAASKIVAVGPQVVLLKITNGAVAPTLTPPPPPTPTPTPSPVGKPDLVVQSLGGFSVNDTHAGAGVIFTATVKNQGSAATPAGTIIGVGFDIDGKEVTWSDTDKTSLAPGATVTLKANSGPSKKAYWTAVKGTHTVRAYVDDINRIAESNETNNKLSQVITVLLQPPLPVTSGGGSIAVGGGQIPGASQPIAVVTGKGPHAKTINISPDASAELSGNVSIEDPAVSGQQATTTVYIDGQKADTVAGNAPRIDTTYLTNGKHVVTLLTKNDQGQQNYTSRAFVVNNKLSPFQSLRNTFYQHVSHNKAVANTLAGGVVLSPPVGVTAAALAYWWTPINSFLHRLKV